MYAGRVACCPLASHSEYADGTDRRRDDRKGKERKSIYIAPFIYYVYLKALRHGSHSFTCKYTMPAKVVNQKKKK